MASTRPQGLSDLALVAVCAVGGLLMGIASVYALSWGDSYERIDSLIGMGMYGTVVGLVAGIVAVAVRALRRG